MATPKNRRAKKKAAPAKSRSNRKAPAKKKKVAATTAKQTNRKAPARKRTPKAADTEHDEPSDWWAALRLAVGILLLPVAFITALALFDTFTTTAIEGGGWRDQGFWFFCLGALIWGIAYLGIPMPNYPYVLGHELTHAFFVYLCGGRVEGFSVGEGGGHVITNKTNLLIVLSPYFVPFYTVIVLGAGILLGHFVDLTTTFHPVLLFGAPLQLSWILFGLVGLTWGFHLTYTVAMIGKDQPDLHINGTFFSLIFIFVVNLALIATGLILASPETSFTDFGHLWIGEAEGFLHSANILLKALLPWLYGS